MVIGLNWWRWLGLAENGRLVVKLELIYDHGGKVTNFYKIFPRFI